MPPLAAAYAVIRPVVANACTEEVFMKLARLAQNYNNVLSTVLMLYEMGVTGRPGIQIATKNTKMHKEGEVPMDDLK